MEITVDPSAMLAVLLGERSRADILAGTAGAVAIAPPSFRWEVGNAVSAGVKRGRLSAEQASSAMAAFAEVRVRECEIDLAEAVSLALQFETYAYDAYVIECARRYRTPLLTLDAGQARVAALAGVSVIEVPS